jgi:serine/threonine protein kinase
MQPVAEASPRGGAPGRYTIYGPIAVGSMATVHFGRLRGEGGFARTVAIKRLHPQYAADAEFVSTIVDEATLSVRIRHPHVVAPLDVIAVDQELLLVMEYIHGEALSGLLAACERTGSKVPLPVAVGIMAGVLRGLHAAHEAMSDWGVPLNIVHRDVSPPNLMVGADGVARVLDFGLAKASLRSNVTRPGTAKGRLGYMAPEQLRSGPIDRRTDVFAAGAVLWEMLALRRLFQGDDIGQLAGQILWGPILPPSWVNPEVPHALDAVVARALLRSREARFATAEEFAVALEGAQPPARASKIGAWVKETAGSGLAERGEQLAAIERAGPEEAVSSVLPGGNPRPRLSSLARRPRPPEPPPAPVEPRRPWIVFAMAATLLAAAGTAAVSRRTGGGDRVEQAPLALPAAMPPEVPLPTVEAPAGQDAPAIAAPPPALAPPRPLVTVRPAVRIRVRRRRARPIRVQDIATAIEAEPAAAPACDPPYVVDGRGIRRVKPECLGAP